MQYPIIISHRGKGSVYADNTIPAFQEAILKNAEMIELDIHETKDNKLIVYHADSIGKNKLYRGKLTYKEIKETTGHNDLAPLLSDCIEAIGDIPINIDIKSYIKKETVIEKIKELNLSKGSTISSRDLSLLRYFHDKDLQIPLFYIISISKKRKLSQNIYNAFIIICPNLLPYYVDGVSIYFSLLRKSFIRTMHRYGKQVYVWSIGNEGKELERFIDMKVDGIITKNVEKMSILKRRLLQIS